MPFSDWPAAQERSGYRLCLVACSHGQITPPRGESVDKDSIHVNTDQCAHCGHILMITHAHAGHAVA